MATLEALPHQSEYQEVPPSHSILIVEDEESIRETIALTLEEEGYEVHTVTDGRDALALLQESGEEEETPVSFDLIILDVMLPQVNGLDVCRSLRFAGDNTPILIVSAKSAEMEKVTGLEVGADDYITKPFSMKELVARCRAMIRRQGLSSNGNGKVTCRKFRDLALYPQECRVLMRGEEVTLAPKEFRLLELFMSYPRRVWSREQLIEQIWGIDFMGDSKTVDVHIRWLREKLEIDPSQPEYLVTVRGFGYRFG